MRTTRLTLTALGLLCAVLPACGGGSTAAVRTDTNRSAADSPPQEIVTLAANTLTDDTGQPSPFQAVVYRSTLDKADAAADAGRTPSDEPVYLFVVEGDFTAVNVPVPAAPEGEPPVTAPHGKFAVIAISEASGEVRTFGVSDTPVDASALGQGINVTLSAAK